MNRREVGYALWKALTEVLDKTSHNVKMRRRFQFEPGADKPTLYPSGRPMPLDPAQVSDRRKRYAESIGLKPTYGVDEAAGFPQSKPGTNRLPYNNQFDIAHEVGHAAMTPEGKSIGQYQEWLSDPARSSRPEPNDEEEFDDLDDRLQDYEEGLHHENVANATEPHVDRRAGVDPHAFRSQYRGNMQSAYDDADDLYHPESGSKPATTSLRGTGWDRGFGTNVARGGRIEIPADHIREDAAANIKQFDEGARFDSAGDLRQPQGVDAKINQRAKVKLPGAHLFKKSESGPNLSSQGVMPVPDKKVSVHEALRKGAATLQAELKKFEERAVALRKAESGLGKSAPPGFSEATMHKLKAKHGVESAFKIAWAAYEKHHGDHQKAEGDVYKSLGDGGLADPSTEKGHANKIVKGDDLADGGAGSDGSSMMMSENCKMCDKPNALCKCGEMTKYAKGELQLEKAGNPTVIARMAANKQKAKKPQVAVVSVDTPPAPAAPAPAPMGKSLPAGAAPESPGPKPGEKDLPGNKKSKAVGGDEGSGGQIKKAGMALTTKAPAMPKPPKTGAPKMPGTTPPPAAGGNPVVKQELGKVALPGAKPKMPQDPTWSPSSKPIAPMPKPHFGDEVQSSAPAPHLGAQPSAKLPLGPAGHVMPKVKLPGSK